ncbi:uncharacterized protein LOC110974740 isoform X3 [Acanthaster planci]|uniref:Uncharacterized protein LOC110974740 isoform X3 n=1 Tax=Acanthaster planci TaxID=133434 RepID=A0A8B7XQF0_ACAPL|nr:uncharacterized protein LOC110974740 isoform X3 [Acanthaster planci]
MIAANKDLRESDKLFKKLIAPSLGSFRLDSHVHHLHAPAKMGPVLLPHCSNSHETPQPSKAPHNASLSVRTPPSTEITLDDSFPKIGGPTTNSAVDFQESFSNSYQSPSGINIRRQQQRAGTSMSSVSCSASVPWTFYSTTKMKQLPLPQVQSSEVLRATSPSPRGKRNISVCSERYLGTSVVGQPHRRSKSAAEVLHPASSTGATSDQVRRFEEERIALLQARTLKKTTKVMAHRKDRKYHMCGSAVPIHDRYMVDSEEMDQLRQLIQARSTKRESTLVTYYGRYGVRMGSGRGTPQTKLSSATKEQKEKREGNDTDASQIPIETTENGNKVTIATPINENEEFVHAAKSAAAVGKENDKSDLAKNDVERIDHDNNQKGEVMADVENSVCEEEHEKVNEAEEATNEQDNPDHNPPISNDGGQDVDQPVEGAITQTTDDVQESPDTEPKGDETNLRKPDVKENPDENIREERVETVDNEEKGILTPEDEHDAVRTDDGDNGSGSTDEVEIQNMMPNVKISKTTAKKKGKDAFMTELEGADADYDDIQDMLGNFKPDRPTSSNGKDTDSFDSSREETSPGELAARASEEPSHPTAEEALLGMIVSDDKIAAMEESLSRIDRLKGGIKDVGHLEGSELNLDELNIDNQDIDYGQEVFGKVRNDEELKEVERLRAEKKEARSAKARKADDSIMATAKVEQAKSKMADIYNFISPRQQEVFEKKFQELDIDGNGVITLQELFKRMYRGKTNRQLGRAFMQVFDLNKDQTIDEREFVIVAALNDKLTGKLTESADAPLELDLDRLAQSITAYKEIFQVTDQDADGRLTLEDIMLVICLSGNLETGIDPEVVQHVYNTIDADDSGTIDFMEYLTYIPFFLKLHKRMSESRHITIAEVERAREAVRSAILKVRGTKDVTMKSF